MASVKKLSEYLLQKKKKKRKEKKKGRRVTLSKCFQKKLKIHLFGCTNDSRSAKRRQRTRVGEGTFEFYLPTLSRTLFELILSRNLLSRGYNVTEMGCGSRIIKLTKMGF